MIKFNQKEWRIFRRLQRKHKVSTEFLRYNLTKIQKIIWYETWPRIIIKRFAIRKRSRVFLVHYRLRRVLFDQANRKIIKRMRQNVRQWSKRVVAYQKRTHESSEYVEETICEEKSPSTTPPISSAAAVNPDDVSKQLKEQLELLKSGRRQQPFINAETKTPTKQSDNEDVSSNIQKINPEFNNSRNANIAGKEGTPPVEIVRSEQTSSILSHNEVHDESVGTRRDWQENLESTPEKQLTTAKTNARPVKQLATDEKTEKSQHEDDALTAKCQNSEKPIKSGLNFLDMLMSKVSCAQAASTKPGTIVQKSPSSSDVYHQHEHSLDSTDGFLGFDDTDRIPGMLMTPIVPNSTKNNKNSIFISERLNEYMRENDLESNYNIDEDKSIVRMRAKPTDLEGLMTPKTQPPPFDMPAVPDNLLRFRTVAERKSYLQKFAKNSRLSIINNEASIYRELQKRIRYQKCKPNSQQISAQSSNSSMSFTRNGWQAASFINTEFNKYYYQMLEVDCGKYKVKLRGVRGNNDEFRKKPYISIVKNPSQDCSPLCVDEDMWHDFKAIKTVSPKTKKLNKEPLPSVFKPCPLSHKALQKPLDDDAAALLLAGGSMAIVRMPTVELEVFPEYGRPLNELAKRYLQYILPHHDISREWAEFSVSTLKLPGSLKDAVKAATDSIPRKSFTFLIPYLNDRNHVLVRRVVDRSEKLDESFEQCSDSEELVPKSDLTFRQNLDKSDDILLTCADVVSDMINTVAISCSENSFIKTDPDAISGDTVEGAVKSPTSQKNDKLGRPPSAASNSEIKKQSKQKRVLLELKRLNATIIDAAVKPEKDKKPCSLEHCALGCVCDSLVEESHVREHCGKTKCMWGCSCKTSNQSRIMRLETDGRTITTEDAFMLRRKATARLARMEKEFTSTVVLTENETLLINETNNDKKRRCTKLPKRYEFYDDETDDEQRKNSPKKTALTTIDNEKNLAVEVKEIREPVYIQDTILDQLKHCTVNLIRLENMENVAPWCMVHQLYKCFCKGKSLEGKPMIIEKDENNTTIEHGGEEDQQHQIGEMDYKMHTTKARYTFEKVEKKKSYNNESDEESDDNEVYTKYETRKPKQPKGEMEKNICNVEKESDKKSDLDSKELPDAHKADSLLAVSHIEKEKPKRSLEEVRERFYASRPECCRRQIPIPRRMFLYCNRKRRLNVLKFIKEHETEKTRLLLNEHVMRSVYYHKTDAEKARKQQEKHLAKVNEIEKQNNIMDEKQKEDSLESTSKNDENKQSFELPISRMDSSECEDVKPKVSEIVDLLDDVEEMKSVNKLSNDINLTTAKQSPAQDENNCAVHNSVITVKNFGTLSSINVEEDCTPPSQTNDSATSSIVERQELMLPKISNCFSLNANANSSEKSLNSPSDVQKLQQHLADLTSATSVNSPAFTTTNSLNSSKTIASSVQPVNDTSTIDTQIPPNLDSESVRDVYNSVIRTMNTLVSKKMQDVDFALRRESHIIPAPNADILCIMKWSNFLDAYCHGFAFIWQVKSKEGTYLVATIRNMMPMICEAMGVVNITALKPERVPLMGRMLLNNIRNEHTTKLAVVMQGKLSYWVVKGFLKADPSMACNKPTPETHPSLTKKINVLCTSLVKQRQKEEKKKEHLQGPKRSNTNQMLASSTNINSQQHTTTTLHQSLLPAPPLPLQTAPLPLYQQQVQVVAHKTISPPQHPSSNHQEQHQIVIPQNTNPASHTVPFVPTDNLATKSNQAYFTDPTPQSRKRKSTGIVTDITSNGITPTKMDSYAKMSTNIEFRKVTPQDINEIHLPEIHKRNHKWLVLDLHNDFSHIFVPDFRDLVSLDRIQKVINFAKQKNKIVKLQFFQNAPFDAFVTPKSGKKIYFGPLNLEMKPPTLILLQSVDGQMMLRELYQMKHNIQKGLDEKTKAFWLLQMNGQTHFEVDHNQGNAETNSSNSNSNVVEQLVVEDEDDDEDCMIIDEVTQITPPTEQQQQPPLNEGRFNFTIGSMPNDTTITIMPQTNSLPGPPPIQTLINSKATATNGAGGTASLLKIANTNTIIKPIVQMPLVNQTPPSLMTLPSNTVITGITPVSASNVSTIATTTTTPTTTPLLLSNAVVTGITPTAPQDAAYGSTIFISPSPAAPSKVNTNLSMPRPPLTTGANQMSMASVHHTKQPALGTSNDSSYRPAPIAKRRRVSVVCHNPYDKISQNIAVSAVINKILPENIQDIQVNQSLETLKTVSTIGSTTITKISDSNNDQQRSTATGVGAGGSCSTGNQEQKTSPSKPLVFDVSFVDGGDDEPTASIVIKPTPSPTKVSTPTSLPPPNTTTMSSTSSLTQRVENAKLCMKTNRSVPYKVIKIPVSSSSTIATGGQAQLLNKIIYTKTTNNPVSSSPSSTVVRQQQQQPVNSTSVLTKKLLNTTNPIKITGITTIPASKATIPVRIAPKPLTCTTNTSTSSVKSLTISSINATSHINSITKTTPLSVSYAKTLTTTSTTSAPLVSSSSIATTVSSQQRQLPTTNSTITSTSTLNSAKSSGLAITSVQSFGTVPTPRTNKNNVIINNVQSLTASSPTATAVQQRNNSNSCKVDKFSCGNIKSTEALSSSLVSPSSSKTSKKKVDGRDNVDNLVLPPHIQYGYIVSPIYNEYKFVAKKVSEEFYVKVPSVGILKLIGLQAVHNYLNKHMLKISEENKRSGDWRFVAASKAVQVQNHQKSLLVRKTKPGMECGKLPTRGESNKSQKVVKVTSISEPILIDD